jgi:hypothetical protein
VPGPHRVWSYDYAGAKVRSAKQLHGACERTERSSLAVPRSSSIPTVPPLMLTLRIAL